MSWQAFKLNYIWSKNRKWVAEAGLLFLKLGRKLLRWSKVYCSWCGRDPGFDSVISSKGLRCDSLNKKCAKEP